VGVFSLLRHDSSYVDLAGDEGVSIPVGVFSLLRRNVGIFDPSDDSVSIPVGVFSLLRQGVKIPGEDK